MVFPKLLKLRDKMLRKRKRLNFDEEKPFLEHLEDLRQTLTRIIVTLLVSMTASMFWYKEFVEVVKWPAKKAGLDIAEDKSRPPAFENSQEWENVKHVARSCVALTESARRAYLETVAAESPQRAAFAEALIFYQAGWSLAPLKVVKDASPASPEQISRRESFLAKALANAPEPVKGALGELTKNQTKPDLEASKPGIELAWRKPMEAFFTAMKLSLYAGVIISFPLLFYFALGFVLPGLTPREKKMLWPALSVGFGLFLAGLFFAFLWVVPRTLQFGSEFGNDIDGTQNIWNFSDYISFVTMFSLVFGLSFELPVVVLVLVRLGLLSSAFMRKTRSWAVIIIVVVAAVITPTGDAATLSALAVPMIIMYEACIWIGRWMEKKQAQREEAERVEEEKRRAQFVSERQTRGVQAALPEESSTTADPTPEDEHSHGHDPHHDDPYHQDEYHRQQHEDSAHASQEDLIHGPEHAQWMREQEEIYRREHPHLFAEESPADAPTDPDGAAEPEPKTSDQPLPPDSKS